MVNGPARAEFWKEFIVTRCAYPSPERLAAQLAQAEFSEFCDCGCNSFAVKVRESAPPLTSPGGGYGSFYEADFNLADEGTLVNILFANHAGNLAFVEVDCCANSYPVPEVIKVDDKPYHHASSSLIIDP